MQGSDENNIASQEKENVNDTANPFNVYYSQIIHQQNMLQDFVRTGTYQHAITRNVYNFRGKTVLDVGAGTGVLSFFAAQAGAKKVYAVEASAMAEKAEILVKANKLDDIIQVIHGKIEEITLPEKVDVIISEPIGFLLVHERMLETYIKARDLFLKPGGLMFPTLGNIYITPMNCDMLYSEQIAKVAFWNSNDFYGIDLTSVREAAMNEHFGQAVVGYIHRSGFISSDVVTHKVEFSSVSEEELISFEVPVHFVINSTAIMHGFGCWFDIGFLGIQEHVTLNTGPDYPGTHWYQCRLLFSSPIAVNPGQVVVGSLKFQANNRFSYNIQMKVALEGTHVSSEQVIKLQDQLYHYLHHPEQSGVGQMQY